MMSKTKLSNSAGRNDVISLAMMLLGSMMSFMGQLKIRQHLKDPQISILEKHKNFGLQVKLQTLRSRGSISIVIFVRANVPYVGR